MAIPLTWRKCRELKEKLLWVRINWESWIRNWVDGRVCRGGRWFRKCSVQKGHECGGCWCIGKSHFIDIIRSLPIPLTPSWSLLMSLPYMPIWNSIPTRPTITSHPQTQHLLTPLFHPRPSGTYNLSSVSSILLLKKVGMLGQKLLLCFLSTLCRPNDVNQLSR